MNSARTKAVCGEPKPYSPAWLREEKPIRIVDGKMVDAELYENDGEIGVVMTGAADIEVVKGNAAIIFGESHENLYLRVDFAKVVKISCGENNRQTFEKLFKTKVATVNCLNGMTHKTENVIPVYHDEGEARFFARHDRPDDSVERRSENDMDDECDLQEIPSDLFLTTVTIRHDDEIEASVDAELASRNGKLVVRHRTEVEGRFSYDVAIVDQRCLVILYFGLEGDWLCEEEPCNGNPPLWFSEKDHTISPVFFARKWRKMARKKNRRLPVAPLVVMSGRSIMINEEEIGDIWKNTCHIGVVRTQRAKGSRLPGLKEYLDSLPAPKGPPKEIDPEIVRNIHEDFMLKYWK